MKLVKKLTVLYLSLFGSVNSIFNKLSFPEEGTFNEQKNYIESLPKTCPSAHSSELLDLSKSPNPFERLSVVPKQYKTMVYSHEFFPENGVATTRKATNLPQNTGTGKGITDETQIMLQEKGDDRLVIHKFKLEKDGAWRPSALPVEGSIENYGKELLKGVQGIVIKMTDDNGGSCFTHNKKKIADKNRPSSP